MREIYLDDKQLRRKLLVFKLKIYSSITVFFLLVVGICYLIIYSPFFQLKNIEIVGNRDFEKSELIQELKLFFISQSKLASILGPNNILIWKEDIDQFKKSNPLIADLVISKDYPNRKIKIEVKERKKFGIWCTAQTNTDYMLINTDSSHKSVFGQYESACRWFDKDGILFAEAPFVEGALINKVSDFTGRQLVIGDMILEQRFFDNLLKIFEVLEKSGLGRGFLKLENLNFQEIVSDSPIGFKIYFSLRINPEFSLAGIKSVKEVGLEKVDYIDFRVENRVYYKIK
ncbi:MAG TPA: FtsQ-type POTRA domain-containing protein [Candidatus Wolfebacteria bacterium]|nr:FtsQ-type POTRA domain-containing protein [Candidatus Wolfebacteria bacterium]